MNIFSSSAPTAAEIQREAHIKDQITDNLRQALKALQRLHVNSDQPIQSEDTANAVCCVLEAIFLHGLKAPVTKKSFWGLFKKMTHKNTLSQLNRLGQITTEVGLCRAWLRLALNDGVLESYIDAILADPKTLRQYYNRTAYLRDEEHPGILKTYIQSLSNFCFQLSYNSSVLNIWSHTPLMLAGLVAPQADPRPVMAQQETAPRLASTRNSVPESMSEYSTAVTPEPVDGYPVSIESRKKKVKQKTQKSRTATRNINAISYAHQDPYRLVTPPNTPYDPSQLTSTDIDAIRKLTTNSRRSSDGTSSTNTSQISHPDPVDARQFDFSIPERRLFPNRSSKNESEGVRSKPESPANVNRKFLKTSEATKTRVMVNSTILDDSSMSNAQSEIRMPQVESKYVAFEQEQDFVSDALSSLVEGESKTLNSLETVEEDASGANPFDGHEDLYTQDMLKESDIGATASNEKSSQKNVGADEDNFKSTSEKNQETIDVLNDKLESHSPKYGNQNETSLYDIYPEQEVKITLESHVANSKEGMPVAAGTPKNSNASSSQHHGSPAASLTKSSSFPKLSVGKSPPLEPELSSATATSDKVEVAKEALMGLSSSLTDSNSVIEEEYGEEGEEHPTGNSLTGREGWSSDFETNNQSERGFYMSDSCGGMMTSVNESFDNMLHNYGSYIGRPDAPTMSEVLDGLPSPITLGRSVDTTSSTSEPPRLQRVPTLEDEVIDEYEVLPDLKEKRAYLSEPRYQPLLDILGTICTEKGLDMQNYQCKGCSRPVGMFYGKARVCGYDSCYYCYECHENEESYIPSRIVYNWDFRKQKVCRQNLGFLQQSEDDPLLNIATLNPKLYDHVQEMAEVKNLRIQLRFLKAYLFTCKQSIADDLRKQVWPREYYYDDIDLYSVNDFLQVATGQLSLTIKRVVKFASKHVYDCGLCSQKGFICEICNNHKVIYPFEMDMTVGCNSCKAVYHKDCKRKFSKCPKCDRRQERRSRLGLKDVSTADNISDYAISP